MRSSGREGRRPASRVLLLALLALATLGLWLGLRRLVPEGRLPGGEAGVRQALARLDRIRVGGPPGAAGVGLDLAPVRFSDVTAALEGGRAAVVAMVEAEGRASFGQASAPVSYVGREAFHLRPCAAGWCPEGDEVSRLRGVLEVLARRQEALAAAAPGRRVLAWQVRVERDRAEAGEDFESPGPGGTPVRERARLSLRWAAGAWALAP